MLAQGPSAKNKIYSLHEPHVYCSSKSKAHKTYEFGIKASIAMTKCSGVTDSRPFHAIVDRGYRGRKRVADPEILVPGRSPANQSKPSTTGCENVSVAAPPSLQSLRWSNRNDSLENIYSEKMTDLKCFVPEYGNFYHFMAESAMGLYRLLADHDELETKNIQIWYKGKYIEIVQMFSSYPVQLVNSESEVPAAVPRLVHKRPAVHEDWMELHPLRNYLSAMFPPKPLSPGILVVERVNRRAYAQHKQLVEILGSFNFPIREAIMENLPFGEQIELMRNSAVLVGPHGSGETNMMFMPPESLILELYPKGFSDRVFSGIAKAFCHQLIEIESTEPSEIGRKPTPHVAEYLANNPWPTRDIFRNWRPERMELGRVLRDVRLFRIDPKIVASVFEMLLMDKLPHGFKKTLGVIKKEY